MCNYLGVLCEIWWEEVSREVTRDYSRRLCGLYCFQEGHFSRRIGNLFLSAFGDLQQFHVVHADGAANQRSIDFIGIATGIDQADDLHHPVGSYVGNLFVTLLRKADN